MRFSTSAVVLSTLAASHVSGHTIRHAEFHARKAQEAAKRGYDVDWNNPELYAKVNWAAIDWKSVISLTNPPTATPAVPNKQLDKAPEVTPTPEPAPAKKPEPTPAEEEEAPKPEKTKPSIQDKWDDFKEDVGEFLEDLTDGIEELCKKKGISKPGKNDKKPNGAIWLGRSDWDANFRNAGDKDVWLACWTDSGFTGMTINVNQPQILAKIAPGKSQTVSFAPKVPSACAPIYPDTPLADFGGVHNTWVEFNYGESDQTFVGTFDVSRNTRMQGDIIDARGSKCTSNMDTCVFKCKDPNAISCEKGYTLDNCGASNGGGGGYDVVMQGVGGGCNMGAKKEHIDVTFKNAAGGY